MLPGAEHERIQLFFITFYFPFMANEAKQVCQRQSAPNLVSSDLCSRDWQSGVRKELVPVR